MSNERSTPPSGSQNDDVHNKKKLMKMNIRSREMLIATAENDLEELERIIKEGIDVNFQDEDGNSALHWAVENSDLKTIEFLLNKEVIISIKNNKNETPIDVAKRIQRQDVTKVLEQALNSNSSISYKQLLGEKLERNVDQISHASKETSNLISNRILIKDEDKEKNSKNKVGFVRSNIYQLKMLMLFLYKGIGLKYSFYLNKPVKDAKNFNNLVFEYNVYQSDKKIYRFLQAKHQLDIEKITVHDLLTENGDYSLIKNFFSYHNLRKQKQYKDGLIEDITICTNNDFDFESLKIAQFKVEKIRNKDDIIDIKNTTKESTRYKFNEGVFSILKPKLQKYIEDKHLSVTLSDNEIKDFLNQFVFAVNQPNEEELGKIIEKELGKEYDFITTKNEYNKLFMTISNWLQRKEKNIFISHEDGNKFFEDIRRGMPILFGIRDPIKSFFGRNEELNHLHKVLQGEGNTAKSRTVCVKGLGGIGKSELARKYVDTYSETYNNKIIWINAENYESIVLSFRKLASEKLKISSKNADGEEKEISVIIKDVYNFFSTGKSLFIFDNAQKYKSENEFDRGIVKFLPLLLVSCNRPYILITSRNEKWPESIQVLHLNVYKKEEAIEFLKKLLNLNDDAPKEHVQELAKRLEFFPLALKQAAALYITMEEQYLRNLESKFNLSDYLKILTEKSIDILNIEFSEGSDNDYTQTILTIWNITSNVIKQNENGDDAMEILNVLAYFAPENIPIKLILNLINNETKLVLVLDLLEKYSIISLEQTQLHLHRLIQEITRIQLKRQNKEQDVLTKALMLFSKINITDETLDHATSVWNYSIKHNKLIEEFTSLPSCIGLELMKNARYEEAYLFALKLSEVLINLPTNNNHIYQNLYELKNNIETALLMLGKYDLALKDYANLYVLEKIIHTLRPNLPKYFVIKKKIISSLMKEGKYQDALRLGSIVLENYIITLGKKHPETLSMKHIIAQIFIHQGKYNESLQIVQEICEIQEDTLGKTHPATLNTKNSIACLFMHQEKLDKASQLLQEVCGIQEAIFSKNHPVLLTTKQNIATLLLGQRRHSEALRINKEIIDIEKSIYGENHPNVLRTQSAISQMFNTMGKYNKALKLIEDVFSKQKDILDSHHPDFICTQYVKAHILKNLGKNTDAISLYQEVLCKKEALLEQNHPDILHVRTYIGEIFLKQGHYDKALELYRGILKIQKDNLGENHFETLKTKIYIAVVLAEKLEYNKALKILQEVYDKLKKLYPNHPTLLEVKQNEAIILLEQKKYDEALKTYRELFDLQTIILGEKDNDTMMTICLMGELLFQQGKRREALDLFQNFEKTYKIKPEVFRSMFNAGINIQSLLILPEELLSAVKKSDFKKIKDLIDKGGDVNAKDNNNISLLHYAVNTNNINIVNILLERGADATQKTNKGNTPLHTATSKDYKEIVYILLNHASRCNLRNFIDAKTTASGTAALHLAAKNGSLDITKSLLKHGAIYNIKNKNDEIPYQLSTNEDIKRLLKAIEELFEDAKNFGNCKNISNFKPDELELITTARNDLGYTILQATKDKRNEF